MMRFDVMVDIETLGTNSDSTIIQIAAIAFDITTGEKFETFNETANIEKNEKPIKVTASTLKWWLNSNKELFAELLNDGFESSEQVLRNFHEWLEELCGHRTSQQVYLLGNGILFDNKMIQHQFESIGLDYPIFYRNDRDLRTLLELASFKTDLSEEELREKYYDDSLITHNAFNDVTNQINLAVGCFNTLTNDQ